MSNPKDTTNLDDLMQDLANVPIGLDEYSEPSPTGEPMEPVVIDPKAEQLAFDDLLKRLADTSDGDGETTVTVLTSKEFSEESFDAPASSNPDDEEHSHE